MTKSGNSGVQSAARFTTRETGRHRTAVRHGRALLGQPLRRRHFGGMMKAADAKLVKKVLKEEMFNDYYIKAVGKHITIKLNGETTVDDDFAKAATSTDTSSLPAARRAAHGSDLKNMPSSRDHGKEVNMVVKIVDAAAAMVDLERTELPP